MADNKVDSILLEIGATTDKADGGFAKTIQNLKSLKEATEAIDTKKLESIRDAFKGFTVTGDVKKAGDGMRSISSAIRSMSNVDLTKLKEISEVISKIGSGLGNLGSNNKINIRIDSEGIKESMQPLEKVRGSLANVPADRSVAAVAHDVQSAISGAAQTTDQLAALEKQLGSSGNIAAEGQQALIDKINEYKTTIKGMESGKIKFDTSAYGEAVNGLERAQNQFDQLKEKLKSTPKTMSDVAKSISSIGAVVNKCGLHTFSGLLQEIAGILPKIGTSGMTASAGFQSMATGLRAVQSAIPIIGIILTVITALANTAKRVGDAMKKAFRKATDAVKSFANKVKQTVSIVMSKFEALKEKVRDSFGVQDKSMQSFVKKIKSLARLGSFMLLRKAFTYLFKYIGEGFNNLVLYSDKFSTDFSKNVSMLYSDLKWLGNAFATAFEPILNYITPMLDALVSKIVSVCNALAQFFAALTGKSTWTRAKKLNEDYGKSVDKTKKLVMGLADDIDELHNLHENTDSDVGATDPGDMFETVPVDDKYSDWVQKLKDAWNSGDFTDIGKELGDKLAKALANIDWAKIKQKAYKLGSSLATLINGFIMGSFDGKSVAWWIGHTLAEALNTAFAFLNSFAINLNWKGVGKAICDLFIGAFDSLNWPLIKITLLSWAQGLSDMLNEIFGNKALWAKAGNFVSNGINSILWALYVFIANFDASKFGKAMGIFFTNALAKINFPLLGRLFSNGVSKVFTALYNFVETFDFDTLADKISGMINNAFDIDWETVRKSFGTACSKFGAFINRILVGEDGEGGINWSKIGQDLMAACVTVIEGIGNFFAELDPDEIGRKIAEFVNSAFNYLAENKEVVINSVNSVINAISGIFNSAISGEDGIQWETIFGTIGDIVAGIDWSKLFGTAFEAIAGAWTFDKIFKVDILSGIGESIIRAIEDGIDAKMQSISEWIGEHFGKPLKTAFDNVLGVGDSAGSEVFGTYGERVVEGFKNGISKSVHIVQPTMTEGFAVKVSKWFCDTLKMHSPSVLFQGYGNNIVQGLINGIKSAYSSLKASVESLANSVSSWFQNKLKIHSPSRLFYSFGQFTVEGFNNAINKMAGSTKNVVDNWAGSFGDMRANLGFSVDYSGLDNYTMNDGADFVVSATREIQGNIDASSAAGNEFDYDTMGYVYKEALREVMTQIVVPAIEGAGTGNKSGSTDRMGLLKAVQEQAAIYSKSTRLDPFPAWEGG